MSYIEGCLVVRRDKRADCLTYIIDVTSLHAELLECKHSVTFQDSSCLQQVSHHGCLSLSLVAHYVTVRLAYRYTMLNPHLYNHRLTSCATVKGFAPGERAPIMGKIGGHQEYWHHYRGTMSNTHGAPLSFLLWGHIPLEQRIGGATRRLACSE